MVGVKNVLLCSNFKDWPKRAVGYDFDGAEFTHVGAKVTFEMLLASFGLEGDAALEQIGTIIHYLDAGGVPVPEAIGLESMLRSARQLIEDDDSLVNEAGKLFQFLYVHYTARAWRDRHRVDFHGRMNQFSAVFPS